MNTSFTILFVGSGELPKNSNMRERLTRLCTDFIRYNKKVGFIVDRHSEFGSLALTAIGQAMDSLPADASAVTCDKLADTDCEHIRKAVASCDLCIFCVGDKSDLFHATVGHAERLGKRYINMIYRESNRFICQSSENC